jgi:hypothetical protein
VLVALLRGGTVVSNAMLSKDEIIAYLMECVGCGWKGRHSARLLDELSQLSLLDGELLEHYHVKFLNFPSKGDYRAIFREASYKLGKHGSTSHGNESKTSFVDKFVRRRHVCAP